MMYIDHEWKPPWADGDDDERIAALNMAVLDGNGKIVATTTVGVSASRAAWEQGVRRQRDERKERAMYIPVVNRALDLAERLVVLAERLTDYALEATMPPTPRDHAPRPTAPPRIPPHDFTPRNPLEDEL